jgi:hypothetical protein
MYYGVEFNKISFFLKKKKINFILLINFIFNFRVVFINFIPLKSLNNK